MGGRGGIRWGGCEFEFAPVMRVARWRGRCESHPTVLPPATDNSSLRRLATRSRSYGRTRCRRGLRGGNTAAHHTGHGRGDALREAAIIASVLRALPQPQLNDHILPQKMHVLQRRRRGPAAMIEEGEEERGIRMLENEEGGSRMSQSLLLLHTAHRWRYKRRERRGARRVKTDPHQPVRMYK